MSEWKVKRLGDLINIKHGYAFKGEYFSEDGPGPLLFTPGNFAIGGGFKGSRAKYYLGPIPGGFGLKSGDLVVTMTDLSKAGDTLGYPAIVPSGPEYLHNQRIGLVSIKSTDEVDKLFLFYALRTLGYRGHVLAGATGSTVRHTSPGRIYEYEFSVPDLKEQSAIAAVLGALDDRIAINDRIVSVVHELGDSCFSRLSSVCRSTLGDLVAQRALIFGDGYRTKRSEHGQPGLPILRVAEVIDGRIEPDFSDFVADRYRSAMGGKISQAGDVILTTKGTVGRVAAITTNDPSFVYSPQLCYFRVLPGSPMASSYIYFWLRGNDFWRQAETLKSQTDMADYLSLTDIRQLTIPVPDMVSNGEMLQTLTSLLSQASARHKENKSLGELRDMLLPKLMSGEIRVRDAERVVGEVT